MLPKPYYDEDGITIYHGDCREICVVIGIVHALTSYTCLTLQNGCAFGEATTSLMFFQ